MRRDHEEAVLRHAVFGTPTFVGPTGAAAYVRLRDVPEAGDSDRAVAMIEELLEGAPYLLEVKRPG